MKDKFLLLMPLYWNCEIQSRKNEILIIKINKSAQTPPLGVGGYKKHNNEKNPIIIF
jgi:hypothetical protein